jgi:epoxyqueuosine reductase
LQGLVGALEELAPGVESLICVDTKPVLERSLAVLAGLGFLGKNGCLIAPGLGSYVLIGLVLITAKWIGADRAPERLLADAEAKPWDACGSCRACLEGCPTEAFEAPGRLDPRRCIAYLTIEHRGPIPERLADALGERVAGCDLCQEVCPYNAAGDREARIPEAARLPPPPGRPRVADLARLATIGNNQHRQFVKRTALNRIPRRALRRNAILALGNGAGPLTVEAREALEQVAAGEDTTLAQLARRALERRLS